MRSPPLALLLLAGCGAPLSNDPFAEDLAYLQALPDREHILVDIEPAARRVGPQPWLLALSTEVAGGTNAFILELLAVVDHVRALSPSERGEGFRAWGPYEYEPGRWVHAEMTRDGQRFAWDFTYATDASGPWTSAFYGEHVAGARVQDGTGRFTFDMSALAARGWDVSEGVLEVDYDLREGRTLLVHVSDVRQDASGEDLSGTYWYQDAGDGVRFEFKAPADVNENGVYEELEVVTRVDPGGAGRGDARVTGGDAGAWQWRISQCWDAAEREVYLGDNLDLIEASGDEADCAYADRADVEHL